MGTQTSHLGYGYEGEGDRRRKLQQAVLLPLTEALDLLARSKHKMVELDDTAIMTTSGMEQLKGMK
jgi:hypothetical protein